MAGPAQLQATLDAMAEAGVDHVVVGDHVSFFVGLGFDGLIQATALSMLHPTLPVYTGVYLLPLRHPVAVARQLSSLAGMAPGRLLFGVGIGGEDRHEVEICGVDPATRGARMEECLQILRGLLTGAPTTHHGRFFDLDDAVILPAPDPVIPIIVGGRSDAAYGAPAGSAMAGSGYGSRPSGSGRRRRWRPRRRRPRAGAPLDWRHRMTVWCGLAEDRAVARELLASAMQAVYQVPFERFERYSPLPSSSSRTSKRAVAT